MDLLIEPKKQDMFDGTSTSRRRKLINKFLSRVNYSPINLKTLDNIPLNAIDTSLDLLYR
jgi:hypothetical protein